MNEGQWIEISDGLPNRWITSVVFDPLNENTIYSTVSGFRWDEQESHIFKSYDLGQNWISIQGDLPEFPINCILVDPENNMNILVGTDAGVFGTDNGGENWNIFGNNLPSVPITDLQIHESTRTLVAGTFGCSAYKMNWEVYQLGDVTIDGVINVIDILQVINFILDNDSPSGVEFELSDINSDNILNVLDIIGIVNIILED